MPDNAAATEALKEWRKSKLKRLRAKKAKPAAVKALQRDYMAALGRLAGNAAAPAATPTRFLGGALYGVAAQSELEELVARVEVLEGA